MAADMKLLLCIGLVFTLTDVGRSGLIGRSHSGGRDDPVLQYVINNSLRENPVLTKLRLFSSSFQDSKNLTPAFQACTKQPVDIVFLFDGSRSMSASDFDKNKDFILDIMTTLTENNTSSIKFAAVQFSRSSSTVFNFNDYQNGRASEYLQKEIQMKMHTQTYNALQYVLNNIFENENSGFTPNATKVVIIITDGHPTDSDKRLKIIDQYNHKNIIRFVIGVGGAVTLERLQRIASEPNNTFLIEDYNGLTGILKDFEKKIYNIEACTKQPVDLVFLFDGSRSMSASDFDKNKDFILDIMTTLTENNTSSIKFAAVQFSQSSSTVFNFNDYQNGRASEYLKKEIQMNRITQTHNALQYVLNNIFENENSGFTPNATKVVIIITDGHPTDSDKRLKIIDQYNHKNIIRFVIGVGTADTLERLQRIASEPNNTFLIEDYNGLTGILKDFEKKIYNIEGSKTAQAEDMKDAMSQSGLKKTLEDEWSRMMVAPEQAQLMANLMRLINASKAIEIGMYTGYNALNMALAMPEDGRVVACEIEEEYVAIAKPFFKEAGVEDRIDVRLQAATETLRELMEAGEAGTYDFVFIDADKANYNTYYEKSLELLRKGGIIAIDNVLWSGTVVNPAPDNLVAQTLDRLNKKLHKDQRIDLSMLTIGDGLTLAIKR